MLALSPSDVSLEGDLVYVDGALVEGRDLETAVYLSLFLDAASKPDDDVAEGVQRRGAWSDAYALDGGLTGSRLWLLGRARPTTQTLRRAETYASEALAWLLRDGLARSVEVRASYVKLDAGSRALELAVMVSAPDGRARTYGPWEVFRGL